MTKLTASNSVIRETAVSDRGRPIIIELHPSHLALRLKGLRETHFVAYDALLWRVMKTRSSGRSPSVLHSENGVTHDCVQLSNASAVACSLSISRGARQARPAHI